MRHFPTLLIAGALLCGCAQAEAPALAPAPKAMPAAAAAALQPIADAEPEVTQQVAAMLASVAAGALPADQFTDSARATLEAARVQPMRVALSACANPPRLALLSRTTKGEDRNYLYRALCGDIPLLVEVAFNKAARINRLVVRAER